MGINNERQEEREIRENLGKYHAGRERKRRGVKH